MTIAMPQQVYGEKLKDEVIFKDANTAAQDNLDLQSPTQQSEVSFDSEALVSETADFIQINMNTSYDPKSGVFYTSIDGYGDTALSSNVMSGMYTQNPVEININKGVMYTLYKDGVAIEDADMTAITEPGGYVLAVYDTNKEVVTPLNFFILGTHSSIANMELPEGCDIVSVTYEDEEMVAPMFFFEFKEEGSYHVVYECGQAGRTYDLKFVRDITPPVLELSEVDEEGIARGPVSIADLEENASLIILHNDERIGYSSVLKDSGHYDIIIYDEAGNRSEYKFTITMYFNYVSIVFMLVFVALIAGLIAYVIFAKKHLRIR